MMRKFLTPDVILANIIFAICIVFDSVYEKISCLYHVLADVHYSHNDTCKQNSIIQQHSTAFEYLLNFNCIFHSIFVYNKAFYFSSSLKPRQSPTLRTLKQLSPEKTISKTSSFHFWRISEYWFEEINRTLLSSPCSCFSRLCGCCAFFGRRYPNWELWRAPLGRRCELVSCNLGKLAKLKFPPKQNADFYFLVNSIQSRKYDYMKSLTTSGNCRCAAL